MMPAISYMAIPGLPKNYNAYEDSAFASLTAKEKMTALIKEISIISGVSVTKLTGNTNKRENVACNRQIFCLVARNVLQIKLTVIGKFLHQSDHTTASRSVQVAWNKIKQKDKVFIVHWNKYNQRAKKYLRP